MPEVRRRPVKTAPVRRRDRVQEEVEDDEEEEDIDITPRRAVKRPTPKRTAAKAAPRRRPVVDDDDEAEDEDEDEEPVVSRRVRRPAPKPVRRRVVEEDDEDDDDEDDEPAPRARKTRSKLPPGVKVGFEGAEEVRASGGGSEDSLTLGGDAQLIKCLQNGPFASFRQHWVPSGGKDRPYTCIGAGCPLCAVGQNPSKTFWFNVLLLSSAGGPEVKVLKLGVVAYTAFKEVALGRDDKPHFDKGFWAVNRSGKNQRSQTNFRPVKVRDLEEDWPEVFDAVDPAELDDEIERAKSTVYDAEIVQVASTKELRQVANYLMSDED